MSKSSRVLLVLVVAVGVLLLAIVAGAVVIGITGEPIDRWEASPEG